MELHERIYDISLNRSIFFPSNEIYGSMGGFYDYGPVGVLIKKRIENLWRRIFLKELGFHEMETSIITPEPVLKASGHVDSFADPVVECKKCKAKMRADILYEEISGKKWDGKLETIDIYFRENSVKCPSCKEGELTNSYFFNMMFKTGVGGDLRTAYCRPETAQGIFVNFLRVFRNHGAKLPLAVGQIGRSFRNEISPRRGLVRMREFTQMELEYFFNPNNPKIEGFDEISNIKIRIWTAQAQRKGSKEIVWKNGKQLLDEGIVPNEIFAFFLIKEWEFYRLCGVDEKRMYFRVLLDEELPHYSKGNIDMEVETSYGTIETIGNAYRTDFDLSSHAKMSGKSMDVFVEEERGKIIPHVFEVSMGVDRLIFTILEHSFREKSKDKEWDWFDFSPLIAPYDVAVFPLMKKDGLPEKALEIVKRIRGNLDVFYQKSGSIGKRYARADEIGIPYSLTVDYQTLDDDTLTIRFRNDGKQKRIKIDEIINTIEYYKKKMQVRMEE